MTIHRIDNPLSDDGRNKLNNNFQELNKNINNAVDTISNKAFNQVVDEAKLNWKEPVATSNDLPANAEKGETRMARDTGKVFRFNSNAWVEIQQIDAGPVNEVDSRLTQELAQTKKVIVNIEEFNFIGDYNILTGTGTDNLQVFIDLVNAYPKGARVVVPEGNYYISDENLLPPLIQGFEFIGIGEAVFTFGEVLGENTYTVPAEGSVPKWKRCKFRDITFSAPSASGYAVFSTGSDNLKFYHCTISDVKSHFVQGTGDVCIASRCNFIAPNTEEGTCLQTIGNVTQYFTVEYCDFDYAPNQGGGCLISATNDDRLIGDYRFVGNKFLIKDKPNYYIDAFIDLEPNHPTRAIKNVTIKDNVAFNSKIYIGAVDNFNMKDNVLNFTINDSGGPAGSPIQGTEAYETAPLGRVVIENNVIRCQDHATYIYKQPILFEQTNTIDTLIIENNKIEVNGSMLAEANAIKINSAGGTIKKLKINGNEIVYTSTPENLQPSILIETKDSNTVEIVEIERNSLKGTVSLFVRIVSGTIPSTVKDITIENNNLIEANMHDIFSGSTNHFENKKIKGNSGYKVENIGTPGIPTNGAAVTQSFIHDCLVYIKGADNIAINGIEIGVGNGQFYWRPGDSITLWYTTTPTWKWVGIQ